MKRDHTTVETLSNVISKIKKERKPKLSVWDIDDTLFKTPSKHLKIYLVDKKTKNRIRDKKGKFLSVTTEQFADEDHLKRILDDNNAVLDQRNSFGAFRDPKIFSKYAKPITKNLLVALKEYGNKKEVFFLALTARDNMDSEGLDDFLNHFANHGLNMNTDRSHIIRARSITVLPGSEAKKKILESILRRCKFIEEVEFWDDSKSNISEFLKLREIFPQVVFIENHVTK